MLLLLALLLEPPTVLSHTLPERHAEQTFASRLEHSVETELYQYLGFEPFDAEFDENSTNDTDGLPGAYTISTGAHHSCALEQSTGAVRCWGVGDYGQLGNSRATTSESPVLVQGLGPAVAVSAGGMHSCAVETTGITKCWGKGEDGQLGFGGRSRRWAARPVPNIGAAANVSAGGSHTCVLERSGIVQCWGWGEMGQLGDGKNLDSVYPVLVSGIEKAIDLCAGGLHNCALEETGSVKCWGWGELGQLGNGTEESSAEPIVVTGVEGAVAVTCGYQHSCALVGSEANLTATCWGQGVDLQLQTHDEVWAKTARRVMRLNEVLESSAPMPTSPLRSVW